MVDASSSILKFDRGIERLLRAATPEQTALPEQALLSPSEDQVQPQLDAILRPPTLDDAMHEFLRPAVTDRSVLSPTRYAALLESAFDKLHQMAASGDPVFGEAAEVLHHEQDLRQLLGYYRSALLKG